MDGTSIVSGRLRVAAIVMAAAGGIASNANSSLLDSVGVSPVSMSLGNAVTADPPGVVEAVHFNPAGLSNFEGRWISGGIIGAATDPQAKFTAPEGFSIGGWEDDPVAGTSTGDVKGAIYIPGFDTTVDGMPFVAAPTFGVSFNKPGSRWTFATALFPQQGLGLDRPDDDDPARFDGRQSIFQRVAYFTPSVAYQLTDTLSVGLAVPVSYQSVILKTDLRFPNSLVGVVGQVQNGWCSDSGNPLDVFLFGLCGGGEEGQLNPFEKAAGIDLEMTSSADVTYNLGVLWEPYEWLAVGAVYQSGSNTIVTGDYTLTAEPMVPSFINGMYENSLFGPVVATVLGLPPNIPEKEKGNVSMKVPYPQRAQVGFKVKPTERLQVNLDVSWADWDQWGELTLEFDKPVTFLEALRMFGESDPSQLIISRNYESEFNYSIGLQYQLNDSLTLRAGYEPRTSSVPESQFDLIAPAPDLDIYSLGVGYVTQNGLHIDIGAGYGTGKFDIPANGSCNLNCEGFFNVIYNPYAGLDVKGSVDLTYFGMSVSRTF